MTSGADSLPLRLRAGDEDALRDLFRALAPQAHALAQRVGGAAAADAVVEEVFLLAWRDPERWTPATFELELLRCVRDTALAARRRGISAAAALALRQTPPAAPPLAEALPVNRESADQVRAALFTLDDAQRELLEAAWFDGVAPADPAALTEALRRLADLIRERT